MRTSYLMFTVLIGGLGVWAQAPNAPSKDAPANELKGMPPRVAPTEYQAHAQAGTLTVAAEFLGHSVPTLEGTYNAEDYVVVEAALFGGPEARTKLTTGDFSLRINGKKVAQPSQPYELVFHSLKDPEWEPSSKETKSKTSMNTGGGGANDPGSAPPPPPKMPIEMRRAMEQRVKSVSMLEGERALPQAGLLFFDYRGKTQSIRSLELIYNGAGGNTTLALQP
ncbi:MAG TPA: hypothetical protein VK776_01795 [Bryobacteraceae bacterium]|jgi:hypothetical protein|nr:hypothetical protein [Bryobacteraceae bacterium]